MTTPNTSTLLTYANVQMAAEAIYPQGFTRGAIQEAWLREGNGRSSRFPEVLAKQFSGDWTVEAHQPNTTLGFSGTLFRYTGRSDSVRGLTSGQLVLSLRSTEFVDDAARDTEATNKFEIKAHGWAFGQIAVIALRSTEFIDDHVRDDQSTSRHDRPMSAVDPAASGIAQGARA